VTLSDDFRARLEAVLNRPTAPFFETAVHEVLREAAAATRGARARVDAFGNLEILYGRGRPGLWFACHTDHPALVAQGDGTATISGGIRPTALAGCRLRAFPPHGDPDGPRPVVAARPARGPRVRLTGPGARSLRKGTPLIPDLPGLRVTKRHLRARAIDDGCAVAACLTALDRLAAARWRGRVGFLFTRAEEVGFGGALAWVRTTRLPRTATIVNLEMSNALRHTPQGEGPILRIGDRISTFGSTVAQGLEATARKLAKADPGFRWQRALMDGGACEATVYAQAGFATGALCLPLKNYHNHDARGGIGHEYVAIDDAENLVRWIVAHARSFPRLDPRSAIDRRLEKLWRKHRAHLERTAARGRGRES